MPFTPSPEHMQLMIDENVSYRFCHQTQGSPKDKTDPFSEVVTCLLSDSKFPELESVTGQGSNREEAFEDAIKQLRKAGGPRKGMSNAQLLSAENEKLRREVEELKRAQDKAEALAKGKVGSELKSQGKRGSGGE